MADLNDPPGEGERKEVAARITQVAAQGRISAADRDIRLTNVRNAQSRSELDLMKRDLDLLESMTTPVGTVGPVPGSPGPVATAAPGPPPPNAPTPYATFTPPSGSSSGITVTTSGNTTWGRLAVVFAVVIAVVAGAVAFFVTVAGQVKHAVPPKVTLPPAATATALPSDDPTSSPAAPGGYALTPAGLTRFVAMYRSKFRTTAAVEVVLYPAYAVVDVPVRGTARQRGWLYREGQGWSEFGGVRAVFPGARPFDLHRLDTAALVRNIARARRTLDVERPNQAYVVINHYDRADPQPSVDVHVQNGFNESGYLATRLDGIVVRAFPHS